jgi:hypothetical protein
MDQNDRTERLLALILLNQMKGASKRDKIVELSVAGFTNVEIADIVQTTTAVVSQVLYETRKGKGRTARKKTAALKTV